MYRISRARISRLGRHQRGFSLIELGIVIAVIAVLAAVVIFGRGFIAAGRVSKAVEATNTIRKASATYVGLLGGQFTTGVVHGLKMLQDRTLLPAPKDPDTGNPMSPGSTWYVAGSKNDGFSVQTIHFGPVTMPGGGQQNAVAIHVKAPNAAQAQDLVASVSKDPNYLSGIQNPGGQGGQCAADAISTSSDNVWLCFAL